MVPRPGAGQRTRPTAKAAAVNTVGPIGEGGATTHATKAGDDTGDLHMAAARSAFPTQDASDAEIIDQSRREPERFGAVFDRYYAQIHGYAARRLGRSLADDVAAETFLIAFAGGSGMTCHA
jgi:hypothetical protein